jgi:phosphatidylglycerophosphate synthase
VCVASKFGAVLDMVTDRCTTACLLCYLCSAYPAYTFWFQAIISVDLASHYMHMYRYIPAPLRLASLRLCVFVSSHPLAVGDGLIPLVL